MKKLFFGCESLVTITIPSTLKIIDKQTLSYCSNLTNVVFKEGLELIFYEAFLRCPKPEHIVLPQSIRGVDYWAFDATLKTAKVPAYLGEGKRRNENNYNTRLMIRSNAQLIEY